jgi:hypothetical protein
MALVVVGVDVIHVSEWETCRFTSQVNVVVVVGSWGASYDLLGEGTTVVLSLLSFLLSFLF